MNILVLADNFTPEIVATSFRTHEHAKVWLEQGHSVTVVTCAPNWPQGQLFPGYRNRLYQEEWIDGIRVIRVWSYMTANKGFLKRTLDYVSFMLSAVFWCWRFPRFDVVLATSPQFFTALAGWLISVLRWRPWIFEVRDLWPASIAAVGASKGRLIHWLERLELFLYRRANRVLVVTSAFRDDLQSRGIPVEKIDLATNGVDVANFSPDQVSFNARERLDIPEDAFVSGYVGTTGMAHGLETLIEAAAACRDYQHIQFLIIGEGAERAALEELARQKGLNNLRFLNRVPHADMPSYLSAFDLPIIHLRPDPVFRTVIPSKLFEFMAMQLPVLMAVEGEAAVIVSDAGCGVCIPSGDAAAMANAILDLAARRKALALMGARGYSK
ncbi:MAG TPA: glycosyltransferase family 4 protein, partial [Nitrospiraceae bacterium]|nr:glycosyltransferase family 4 protein [Nitrospiraceae bacterium]